MFSIRFLNKLESYSNQTVTLIECDTEVGGFCCPAPPEPLESASVARCGPDRAKLCNVCPLGHQLRGKSERLVIVGTCRFERFYGAFRPGKNTVFQHTSILVRPHQKPPVSRRVVVEPPGTAPGSAAPISRHHLSP